MFRQNEVVFERTTNAIQENSVPESIRGTIKQSRPHFLSDEIGRSLGIFDFGSIPITIGFLPFLGTPEDYRSRNLVDG